MSIQRRPGKPPKKILRRVPKQERSKDRVSEILKVSADLIGEKGIDAVTMKEIGSRSGGPIASVYQYFSDKEAIVASLYEQYVTETRFILKGRSREHPYRGRCDNGSGASGRCLL